MIDKPGKTQQLLAGLEASLPFEVDLTTELLATLMKDQSSAGLRRRQTVTGVTYMGDAGGIMCHIRPENEKSVIVASITHVRVPAGLPFAAAVLDYQKHRVKKLREGGER